MMTISRKEYGPAFYSSYVSLSFIVMFWIIFSLIALIITSINRFDIRIFALTFLPPQLLLLPIVVLLKYPNARLMEKVLLRLQEDTSAIKIPSSWPKIDCPRKEIRKILPIIGWCVSPLYDNRYATLESYISERLLDRKEDISDYWKDYPDYMPVVLRVQKILRENCWNLAHIYPEFTIIFAPDDDYFAIGEIETGDLCEVEAIMGLEEAFDVQIFRNRDLHSAFHGSMLDVVCFLHSKQERQQLRPADEATGE